MRFHSGFALQEDAVFFDALLHKSDFTISGFSYGAIMAFEEALQSIGDAKRIDRLQLFHPPFFKRKVLRLNAYSSMRLSKMKQHICINLSAMLLLHLLLKMSHIRSALSLNFRNFWSLYGVKKSSLCL